LYKTLFATNFVENTCKFYNFAGNDYSRRNYLPIKILRENDRKSLFLQIFLTNLQKKTHVIWEFVIVILLLEWGMSSKKRNCDLFN